MPEPRGPPGRFFISGILRTTDLSPCSASPPSVGAAVYGPEPEREGSHRRLLGAWVGREDRVGGGLVPWGPWVGASGSEFGTKEASVILKTLVYSFVWNVALLCLFDASSLLIAAEGRLRGGVRASDGGRLSQSTSVLSWSLWAVRRGRQGGPVGEWVSGVLGFRSLCRRSVLGSCHFPEEPLAGPWVSH